MTNIDNELWYKIKENDIKAFELVFNKYYGVLCSYSYRLIKDEETAKERVSDTFMKLWKKRHQIEITQGLKPYLFRSVHNSSIDYLDATKLNRLHPQVEISDKIKELIADEDYFLDKLIIEEVESDVWKAIDQLPQQCRNIFCLSRFNLLTYNEISERLNISVNTVKTQICRALISLRKDLKKYL
jgi:RNA polymerase sigma-70 factor (ECF subfamily)